MLGTVASRYQRSFFLSEVQPGRRRYRCDSDHRNYCSSLLERYQVPPAQEAVDDGDDEPNHDEVSGVSLVLMAVPVWKYIGLFHTDVRLAIYPIADNCR